MFIIWEASKKDKSIIWEDVAERLEGGHTGLCSIGRWYFVHSPALEINKTYWGGIIKDMGWWGTGVGGYCLWGGIGVGGYWGGGVLGGGVSGWGGIVWRGIVRAPKYEVTGNTKHVISIK